MPLSLDADTVAALEDGAIIDRGMIKLSLGSGDVGFWTGIGPLVYNSLSYTGAADLIEAESFRQTSTLAASQVVVRVSSVPNSELTPGVLAQIEAEDYWGQECTLYTAYFDALTNALLSVEVDYRGYIDRVVHAYDDVAVLEIHLESRFRDHQRTGYRMRSDVDQRRISSNDDALRHTGMVAHERQPFGRTNQAEQTAEPKAKPKTFFGKIWSGLFG